MKKFIILALLLSVSLSIGATEYVMIGPKAFEDTCQVLLTLRTSQGFTSSYLAVEDIWANPAYNGVDEQEEIRNAILDYYTNNSTKYVVIVGDTNLVPVRHLIVAEDINFKPGSDSAVAYASAPADLYYSCLNGSFNFDGDTRWGEMDDGPGGGLVDLTLHVAVGRIAAGNLKELRNHIFKIISYELAPDQTDVLMIGEEHSYAYESWDTWNGDLLDAAFNATLGPNGYTATTLYDRDNTNTDVAILNEINTGNHEILLNGQHASPYGLLKMDYNNVLTLLTNTTYFFLYTTGCNAANFKVGSPFDTYGDSFAKAITARTPHGAYAYIGHSSTGWPESIETYLTQMLDFAMQPSTNPQEDQALGTLLNKARVEIRDNLYPDQFDGTYDYTVKRQLYFNLSLLGDPLSPIIKTNVPTPANPGLPDISVSSSIRFTAPEEEHVFAFNEEDITMTAENSNTTVSITSAKFYYEDLVNGGGPQYMGENSTSPYSYTWINPPVGEYLLIVEGYDGTTLVEDDTIFVRVVNKNIPVINSVYFPSTLTQYAVNQPIYFTVDAEDPDGWIEAVQYSYTINDGTTSIPGMVHFQNDPFVGKIFPNKAGSYTLDVDAKVLDNHYFESGTVSSPTLTYTVVEVNPPTVEIPSPADNSIYTLGDTISFDMNGEDLLNWRGDPAALIDMRFTIVHEATGQSILANEDRNNDGVVNFNDAILNLGLGLPQSATFTPSISGTYVITLTGTDTDLIVAQDIISVHVINPNDPFSFERPGNPWTSPTAGLSNDYSNKTEGAFSLVINNTGNMLITSPAFSTGDFDHLSDEISLDIYMPATIVPYPGGYGTISIYINNYIVGEVDLSTLSGSLGSWATISFPLSNGLQRRLRESHSNMTARIRINTQQTGEKYQIDNLRFSGNIYERGPSILQNPVPGAMIEAEDFDFGTQNNAFYDTTYQNEGGGYRLSRVDLEPCERYTSDTNYNLGWTEAGEWLTYTINVSQDSNYDLDFIYSAQDDGPAFHLEIDGTQITDSISLDSTGGWQTWEFLRIPDFHLSAGQHDFRIVVDSPGFNLDAFSINLVFKMPYGFYSIPGTIEAEYFDNGGEGVSYHDTDYLNQGGEYFRGTRVDIAGDNEGGYVVGYIADGEWLEYSILTIDPGVYDIDIVFGCNDDQGGKGITVSLDGTPLGTVHPWNTGGWETWQTVSLEGIPLPASTGSLLRLDFAGEHYNVNRIIIDNNKLENGDFSHNLDNWHLGVYEGASASFQNNAGQLETIINWGGTQNWNVQVTQPGLSIENGKTYIIHFDAMADSNRTINVNVGMAGDPYTSYGGTDFGLTTTMTSYVLVFQMTEPTDNNARFEFNLGADNGDVIIDNVRITEQYDPNLIINGNFTSNLDNWNLNTYEGASAWYQQNSGQMETVINWGGNQNWNVQVTQTGLTIISGKTYLMTFDARADSPRAINANVGMPDDPYTSYGGDDFYLTTSMTTFTHSFTMTEATDNNARFEFNLGANSEDVIIDNVRLEMQ